MASGNCSQCGAAHGKTAKFCKECGAPVNGETHLPGPLTDEALADLEREHPAEPEAELFAADTVPAAPGGPPAPAEPTPAAGMVLERVDNPGGPAAWAELREGVPLLAGASSEAGLRIEEDPCVSRRHATFTLLVG